MTCLMCLAFDVLDTIKVTESIVESSSIAIVGIFCVNIEVTDYNETIIVAGGKDISESIAKFVNL